MKKTTEKSRALSELNPTERAKLDRARTLGLDQLGWVHGAGCCPSGGCCVWEKHIQ